MQLRAFEEEHDQHAPEIALEVPARAEYVAVVRTFVSSLAAARRVLDAERVDDLKLAVSEACTNAIEAYGSGTSGDKVLVRWREEDDFVEVSVCDLGPGFDLDGLPGHPPVTDPDRLKYERGLGIPLIRRLVDDVDFRPSSRGTSVSLVLRCERSQETPPPGRRPEGT